ncbi:hypothetical protein ASPSYDRAFT_36052 [Aspergillus sydowii CBS 593.65]|uniref:Uncharacterized protein n=1 Tax=Aspergillus sydowii CBS 593.65 TaxID=1036612 RepID=A0A1L9T325_9EURO|nr:uncharacterized protein ASPSYDRAFT_36052 [Aspergillus sydowii CBS 593.65]OJJ53818.1 hypothetical protein ASPSYDRAFT_36052 [Aspergillus sydowii CBS 593.65]
MRVSNLLLIVPIMANTALGAIAIYIDEGNGGIVNFSYEAAYWTGPPTDDFSGDLPGFDTCQIQSPGSSCEVGGYKLTLSATGVSGCNQGVDVESASIENSSGDKIENVNGDDRCSEKEYCDVGAVGGFKRNGWVCDF